MANSSKDRLKKLNREGIINIPINEVVEVAINDTDHIPCYSHLAGILRFCSNKVSIQLPKYRMIVLADNIIYCYNKIHYNKRMTLDSYSATIEFKTASQAKEAWHEIMGTDIITYGIK